MSFPAAKEPELAKALDRAAKSTASVRSARASTGPHDGPSAICLTGCMTNVDKVTCRCKLAFAFVRVMKTGRWLSARRLPRAKKTAKLLDTLLCRKRWHDCKALGGS